MLVITDSACDLTPEDLRTTGIQVVPLYIQFPEGEVSSADLTSDEFFNRLRALWPQIPTTSQPSVGLFVEAYQKAVAAGEEVLSIHISSGLSGTPNAATLAARDVPEAKVTVIDTFSLSCEQRLQVLAAHMAVKAGWGVAKIRERLDAIRAASQLAFTLEQLDYLAKGGRIGRVQALAGGLFHIKPIITVEKADGKYSTLGRGRTVNQTINTMVDHYVSKYGDKPVWVTVAHGQIPDKAEAMAEQLRSRLNIGKLDIVRVSPVLGVHTGPGIVGASIVPMELFEGLL